MATSEIIGREAELALLEQQLDALPNGGPAALVVEGEAGIGKTTLLRAAASSAARRDYRVLSCRPAESEIPLSHAALSDLLEDVAEEALTPLPAPQRHALEIALRLRAADAGLADPRTVGVAFLNVLRDLAGQRPVVVAIDDLHWLDGPTAAAVEYAARRLAAEPLLLLATARPHERRTWKLDVQRTFPEGRLTRLEVGPLSLHALHHLVRDRLGATFSRPDLVRLHEATGGNPFYALEIARARERRRAQTPAGQPLPLPETLEELVDERLAELPAPVRRVLEAAAALSEPTVSVVAAASVGEDAISDALEAAAAAKVIVLDDERVRFTHPLLAASAYTRMAPPRRRRLHRRLAALVDDPEASARHLALGATGPSDEVAATAQAAASLASSRGAPAAAAELAELAIRLTPAGRDGALQGRRLAAARQHLVSGDRERARTLLEELRTELRPGPERSDVLRSLAHVAPAGTHEQLELLQRAVGEAAGDASRSSRIEHALGECWFVRGDSGRSLAAFRRALALAEESGDRGAVVLAVPDLLRAEVFAARLTPRLAERAFALEREPEDPFRVFSVRTWLALFRLLQGRLADARALLETALAEAAAHGNEGSRVNAFCVLSQVEGLAGDWEPAERHATEACELRLQFTGDHHPWPLYARALIAAHRGHVESARETAELGLSLSEQMEQFHGRQQHGAVLGFLQLSLGDVRGAQRTLTPLLDELLARGWALAPHPGSRDALEVLIAAGETERARELIDRFGDEANGLGSPLLVARGHRLRGLLCSATGERPAALAAFGRALALQEAGGWPFERGRTLLALGRTQRRALQRRAARESLQAALALFDGLGAPLWAAQAGAELASISGRGAASDRLTPAEERVAQLVVEGRTNRETAAALHLSRHTVEGHLSRIYAKLGIRSRTELARLARTHDGGIAKVG
jgi:DNA-binding CsgD family transcriptional regulator